MHLRYLLTLLLFAPAPASAWEMRGPAGVPTGVVVEASARFTRVQPAWAAARQVTASDAIVAAATDALAWMDTHPTDPGTAPGLFAELGVDRGRVRRTLVRLVEIAREDTAAGRASRLADPAFLAANFELYRWHPDRAAAAAQGLRIDDDVLRLTRYFVPEVEGRAQAEGTFTVALYADPGPAWAHLTRMEVFGGAFEPGGVAAGHSRPLVWLTEAHAHDALLQGTISVRIDGRAKLLNVDRPNVYPYRPGVGGAGQERLWYFKEVDGLYGWAHEGQKVRLTPGASVAGDPWNLGVGKLIVLEHPGEAGDTVLRLVVVGDTGGAFQPNLFQLDWLAGTYPDRKALYAATRTLPDRAKAAVLLVREPKVEAPLPPH